MFIIDLRRSQTLMIKGKSLNSLYLFNSYLGRQLMTFKHVNCLPEEVENYLFRQTKMLPLWHHPVLAPSCITHSSQDTQTPEPTTQWDCHQPPEAECSDGTCTAEGITFRCNRTSPGGDCTLSCLNNAIHFCRILLF